MQVDYRDDEQSLEQSTNDRCEAFPFLSKSWQIHLTVHSLLTEHADWSFTPATLLILENFSATLQSTYGMSEAMIRTESQRCTLSNTSYTADPITRWG